MSSNRFKTMKQSVLSAAVAAITCTAATTAMAASLPTPMVLKDFGNFYVNGQKTPTNFASASMSVNPVNVVIKQMFVQYMTPYVPFGPAKPQVVMVHGSNHTGVTWGTTPDGREGWATYFVRKGYPVWVVDVVGRARSSFDATGVNQSKVQNNAALNPGFARTSYESAFTGFRLGPSANNFWPDSRFPIPFYDQYNAQLVPNTEQSLPAPRLDTTDALKALVHQIGPSVLMGHSFGTQYCVGAGFQDPAEVKGVINLEGTAGHVCNLTSAELDSYQTVKQLTVFADHIAGSSYASGYTQCKNQINATNTRPLGDGTFLDLPASGITGNSHMMMMENNNLQIADLIIGWIQAHVH